MTRRVNINTLYIILIQNLENISNILSLTSIKTNNINILIMFILTRETTKAL